METKEAGETGSCVFDGGGGVRQRISAECDIGAMKSICRQALRE